MDKNASSLVSNLAEYYENKLSKYGATPAGVDWNGEESQVIRFNQLIKILPENEVNAFTMADLGCGYGALYDHLERKYKNFSYLGYDISPDMCEVATDRLKDRSNVAIKCSESITEPVEFGIASGIFSVRLKVCDEEWDKHIVSVLDHLDKWCIKGFSFNCLTSFSEPNKMKDYLHYADPAALFKLCKDRYSRNVSLLHDYDLYEFTILVRK